MSNPTRESQISHFRELLARHHGTPMAVSSESVAHKQLRYARLSRVFEDDQSFTIHDVGMGLGEYYAFIRETFPDRRIDYSGSDILAEYCSEARKRFPEQRFYCRDITESDASDRYDYVVMSGVFHQRRDVQIPVWEQFAQSLLSSSFHMCRKAIAFNFISPFVDFYQLEVYYCNIWKLVNFIRDELSRFFVIDHSYPLFEFTVLLYREDYVKQRFAQSEFRKYFGQ